MNYNVIRESIEGMAKEEKVVNGELFSNLNDHQNPVDCQDDKKEPQFVTLYDINGNPSHIEVIVTPEDIIGAGMGMIRNETVAHPTIYLPQRKENANIRHYRTDTVAWLRYFYPELATVWQSTSGSQFYQGGVDLLCSLCKLNTASGFHEGRPICECDRRFGSLMCTVCRLRKSSCIYYGLAICDDDKNFLDFTLSNRPALSQCYNSCPPHLISWCCYCRLKTFISTPGLRLSSDSSSSSCCNNKTSQLGKRRKFSSSTVVKELNFLTPPVITANNKIDHEQISTTNLTDTLPLLTSIEERGKRSYYDGQLLGSKPIPRHITKWRKEMSQENWVLQQQIKYLNYHLALYRKINGPH